MAKRLILCDCSGSQSIDKAALSRQCEVDCSRVYSALCTTQIDKAASEIAKGDAIVACLQERVLFQELAEEIEAPIPAFVDLRDRAGWSQAGADASAKMAALISDALLTRPGEKMLDIASEGRCIILGAGAVTLPVAEQLQDVLAVTVLLQDGDELPLERGFDVVVGRLKRAHGTLGAFTVDIDALQQVNPAGRGAFALTPPRDGARSHCDIIVDLRGEVALFGAPQKRDGYLRCDPGDPRAVARVAFDAAQMTGSFEKPLYLNVQPHLCAHSRAGQAGCSNCIDVCTTSAISPDGDHVSVDPLVCAGCSACVAVCPSGALTFDAPPTEFTFRRIETLARSYIAASGTPPRLLVCDGDFGGRMISLAARFGRGLPPDVIPLEMETIAGFGHAEILAALACGFAHVDILLAPTSDAEVLKSQSALAVAICGHEQVRLLDIADPEALSDALYDAAPRGPALTAPILPQGSRRQVTRLAAAALSRDADATIPLPAGAPYGAVLVDPDACTLCLSCASLCPTGALADNPELPQVRFQEDACLQCGLCVNVCPENAIQLQPRLTLSDSALTQVVLHEEEPFACVECGALFGVKSTIERISEQLAGKHAMFATSDRARMIQMCDKCRIQVQYHSENNPFQGGERPRVVTTEDYFGKRRDH